MPSPLLLLSLPVGRPACWEVTWDTSQAWFFLPVEEYAALPVSKQPWRHVSEPEDAGLRGTGVPSGHTAVCWGHRGPREVLTAGLAPGEAPSRRTTATP